MKIRILLFIAFLSLIFSNIVIAQRLTFFSDTYQEYIAQKGEKYSNSIIIKNESQKPIILKVYLTEQIFYCNGFISYDDIDSNKNSRSNSKWIFCQSFIKIPPKGYGKLNYIMQVPDDIYLTGSYWSVIMVEPTDERLDTIQATLTNIDTKKKKSVTMSVQHKYRIGFTIVTHIGQTGIRKVEFKNIKLIKNEKSVTTLQFNLENNGERGFFTPIWCELYNNSTGMRVKNGEKDKFEGVKTRLFPNNCILQNIKLGNLTPGIYKALIYVDGGEDDLFVHQVDLKIE